MVEHPKLHPTDEGEVLMAIRVLNNHCIIEYPKPVKWIALHKKGVEKLLEILQERVKEMKDETEQSEEPEEKPKEGGYSSEQK